MRRRKGLPIHGWLNLDKPVGPTSTQAIGRVRRITGAARIGHAGTLDPLASGVLPIALGEATKTVPYIQDARKIYRFTVRWGQATNTDDAEGEVISESAARPDLSDIQAALPGQRVRCDRDRILPDRNRPEHRDPGRRQRCR